LLNHFQKDLTSSFPSAHQHQELEIVGSLSSRHILDLARAPQTAAEEERRKEFAAVLAKHGVTLDA
tara:strand:+ start:779 stop:976 length:198 start_codon:yes stop_codon:yes gene_type:complete